MKKKILGIFVTLLFFVFILYKINFAEVLNAVRTFSPTSLCYIVGFYSLSLLLRGVRWKLFLGNDSKYSWFNLAEIFTIGTMLNIFLPARAGDVYRAYYLGKIKSEKKMKIFGSVILERIFDGAALFFILLFATRNYFSNSSIINTTVNITGVVFLGSMIAAVLLLRSGKVKGLLEKFLSLSPKSCEVFWAKLRVYFENFSEGFSVLNKPLASGLAFGYSFAIWVLECIVTFLIINSFGVSFPVSASLFVLSLITFSTMIPSTSIFLGPFQAAYILALSIYNVDKEFALGIAVVHNVILTLIVSIIGLFSALRLQLKSKNSING